MKKLSGMTDAEYDTEAAAMSEAFLLGIEFTPEQKRLAAEVRVQLKKDRCLPDQELEDEMISQLLKERSKFHELLHKQPEA